MFYFTFSSFRPFWASSASHQLLSVLLVLLSPIPYGPGVDSASNRNEYQEFSLVGGGGKGRPARKADKQHLHLWADCLEKMWELRRLTNLWAFTASYRDSFTFFFTHMSLLFDFMQYFNIILDFIVIYHFNIFGTRVIYITYICNRFCVVFFISYNLYPRYFALLIFIMLSGVYLWM
jgi:hypothetical protein